MNCIDVFLLINCISCELRLKEKIKKKDPDSKKEADIATNYLGNGYCNQELLKNTLNKLREKGKAIEPKK